MSNQIQNRRVEQGNNHLAVRIRPRSLTAQVSTLLLQPGVFYRTLPAMAETRQWLWIGLIILLLVGLSAVRQQALLNDAGTGDVSTPIDGGISPDPSFGGGGGPVIVDGGFPGGGPPVDGVPPTGTPTTSVDVTATWTTALVEASSIVLGWFILALLLSEVSLFNGKRPQLGQNLQISIWATLPIALMAGLQILYYAAGGKVGEPGLAGLVERFPGYEEMPTFGRSLLLSLTTRLTLFWVWSLVLIYFGARYALKGKRWAVMLVLVVWVTVVVVAPVVTGAIAAPTPEGTQEILDPSQQFSPPEGGFEQGAPGTEGIVPSETQPADTGAKPPMKG
jgi:hypothetical protein